MQMTKILIETHKMISQPENKLLYTVLNIHINPDIALNMAWSKKYL